MTDFYVTSVPIGGNQNPMLTNAQTSLSLLVSSASHGSYHWTRHHHRVNHPWR